MMPVATTHRRLYVQRILDLYRQAPGTSGQIRRCDRQLAAELFHRRVPLEIVRAALLLAVARRAFRPAAAHALPLIATLHYFRPVIDELLAQPPVPGYVDYLRGKLAGAAPAFVTAADPRLP